MIMLVEDDFSIRDGLSYYLEQEGFKVKSFEKGMDAVENFNDESITNTFRYKLT